MPIIVFLKKLRPLLLYLTYSLVQIFISFNKTDVPIFKQVNKYGKRIVLIFYTHCIKLEESQNHYFPIYSWPFFLREQCNKFLHSFFKLVCFEKNCLRIAGFLQSGALYANILSKCL